MQFVQPTEVEKTEDAATGDTALIFKTATGEGLTINLTPELQSLVLLALLARPRDPQSEPPGQHSAQNKHRHRTLLATGTVPFHLNNGHQGLQFHMGPTGSIDIAFPTQAIPVIQKALEKLAAAHRAAQGPKH